MIDERGHIIHIDYGFLLGTSPGKNMGFEVSGFKLSGEMIELLGGDQSDVYKTFVTFAVRGFLAARHVMPTVMAMVSAFADSGLPCFLHKPNNLALLRNRFVPDLSSSEAAESMRRIIVAAKRNWTTGAYDVVQGMQHGIFSPEWH